MTDVKVNNISVDTGAEVHHVMYVILSYGCMCHVIVIVSFGAILNGVVVVVIVCVSTSLWRRGWQNP